VRIGSLGRSALVLQINSSSQQQKFAARQIGKFATTLAEANRTFCQANAKKQTQQRNGDRRSLPDAVAWIEADGVVSPSPSKRALAAFMMLPRSAHG
jgi:hypothetical protein